jgi:hypothetical protein
MSAMIWLILRICIVLAAIAAPLLHHDETSSMQWVAWVLIPLVAGGGLYTWLYFMGRYRSIDKGSPFSIRAPFFPINRHPAQFWVLCSYFMMATGVTRMAVSIYFDHRLVGSSVLSVTGGAVLIAVVAWYRMFGKKLGH